MKLTMLGTGHAAVTKCYNTCFALTEGNRHFLVDAGGGNGILERLKAAEIPVTDIHDIFVTHEHVDHLLGVVWMIRMIGTAIEQGKYQGELRIYCHEDLKRILTTIDHTEESDQASGGTHPFCHSGTRKPSRDSGMRDCIF